MKQLDLPFSPPLPALPRNRIMGVVSVAEKKADYDPSIHIGWAQDNGRLYFWLRIGCALPLLWVWGFWD